MKEARDWQGKAGESWAAEYRRTDRSFGGLTEKLLARTRDFTFNSVLDVGCGAGELSLAIGRGRPHVEVIGLDISAPLVGVASQRGEHLINVSFAQDDAATWTPGGNFRPDFLVSRHGMMFFDDPVAVFSHLARIAAPGAGLLFSCFREPARNEMFSGVGKLLPPLQFPPDPKAPGPMAFADPDHVTGILRQAGWANIELEAFDYAMVVGAGVDPVADAMDYLLSIGTAAERFPNMASADRKAFVERLESYLASKRVDNIVALRAAAWLVSARAG